MTDSPTEVPAESPSGSPSDVRDEPLDRPLDTLFDPPFDHGELHPGLPITTTFDFPGWEIDRWLGPCFGLIVRSMGFGNSFVAGFRGLARTEMVEYTRLLEDSRREAIDRLVFHARSLGANGIVGMRFDSSQIGGQFTEIVAYGTAVLLRGPVPSAASS